MASLRGLMAAAIQLVSHLASATSWQYRSWEPQPGRMTVNSARSLLAAPPHVNVFAAEHWPSAAHQNSARHLVQTSYDHGPLYAVKKDNPEPRDERMTRYPEEPASEAPDADANLFHKTKVTPAYYKTFVEPEVDSIYGPSNANILEECPGFTANGKKCGSLDLRICMQVLDGDGEPRSWGSAGHFWNITEQKTGMRSFRDARPNNGDSWCISLLEMAKMILNLGCENVPVRCKATDIGFVRYVIPERGWGPTWDTGVTECLLQRCPEHPGTLMGTVVDKVTGKRREWHPYDSGVYDYSVNERDDTVMWLLRNAAAAIAAIAFATYAISLSRRSPHAPAAPLLS